MQPQKWSMANQMQQAQVKVQGGFHHAVFQWIHVNSCSSKPNIKPRWAAILSQRFTTCMHTDTHTYKIKYYRWKWDSNILSITQGHLKTIKLHQRQIKLIKFSQCKPFLRSTKSVNTQVQNIQPTSTNIKKQMFEELVLSILPLLKKSIKIIQG